MHEILIILVIIVIVGFQVKIFLDAKTRINIFKEIIPGVDNFETVRVFIPESQIKDIKVDYVLENLERFQQPQFQFNNVEIEDYRATDSIEAIELQTEEKDVVDKIISEELTDYESLIWVSKGNEEKKIKLKFLKGQEMLGWTRIQ